MNDDSREARSARRVGSTPFFIDQHGKWCARCAEYTGQHSNEHHWYAQRHSKKNFQRGSKAVIIPWTITLCRKCHNDSGRDQEGFINSLIDRIASLDRDVEPVLQSLHQRGFLGIVNIIRLRRAFDHDLVDVSVSDSFKRASLIASCANLWQARAHLKKLSLVPPYKNEYLAYDTLEPLANYEISQGRREQARKLIDLASSRRSELQADDYSLLVPKLSVRRAQANYDSALALAAFSDARAVGLNVHSYAATAAWTEFRRRDDQNRLRLSRHEEYLAKGRDARPMRWPYASWALAMRACVSQGGSAREIERDYQRLIVTAFVHGMLGDIGAVEMFSGVGSTSSTSITQHMLDRNHGRFARLGKAACRDLRREALGIEGYGHMPEFVQTWLRDWLNVTNRGFRDYYLWRELHEDLCRIVYSD